jgi:hypothetical protein
MRLLARGLSLAVGLATTAALAADPPQAAASPPAPNVAKASAKNAPGAAAPLRLQLSQSELATVVSQSEESAPSNGSAAAEKSGSTEPSSPASRTGRTVLSPSPAGAEPARRSEPVRAPPDSKSSPVCAAARTALPWVATVGAFFAATKAGGTYVEPDFNWLSKKPDAREGSDSWRNHAAPARGVAELPSTLRR